MRPLWPRRELHLSAGRASLFSGLLSGAPALAWSPVPTSARFCPHTRAPRDCSHPQSTWRVAAPAQGHPGLAGSPASRSTQQSSPAPR